jgi:para-nitrobenzyl esterase
MVQSYFTNFAKTGNPNGPELPAWPEFGTTAAYVKFTREGTVEEAKDLRGGPCRLFKDLIEMRLKQLK